MPEAAPVMAATLPDSLSPMVFSFLSGSSPAMGCARAACQGVDDDRNGQHGAGNHVPKR